MSFDRVEIEVEIEVKMVMESPLAYLVVSELTEEKIWLPKSSVEEIDREETDNTIWLTLNMPEFIAVQKGFV